MTVRGLLRSAGAALAAMLVAGSALAVQPEEILSDKALEGRARRISAEIRCLVCQNQSIDDSDAPLARDLRVLVRERLRAGDSDRDVRDFVVSRYGTFVLLRPPVSAQTALLWFGPPLVLAGAGLALVLSRRRRSGSGPVPLTPDEQSRLAAILSEDGSPPGRAGPAKAARQPM